MTNEERDLITRFIERVGGPPASGGGFASVPTTTGQNLPPIDRDADALLAELFQKYPEARYRITQVAVVQEQALAAANQRMNAQQAELQRAQQQAGGSGPWNQSSGQPAPSRGLFGGLFGGGSRPAPQAAPPPQYAQPAYAPPMGGAFQPQGQGFLGGALQTAAGVAGGVLAANALTSLFSGGGHSGGMFGGNVSAPGDVGYLPGGGEGSPWGGAAGGSAGFAPDPFDQGGALKDTPASDQYADNSSWTPVADQSQDSGWQDASSGDTGGGWDSGTDSGWSDSSDT